MTNAELKEYLEINMRAFRAELKANQDIQDYNHHMAMQKMDEMICHQLETNGRVTKNEMKTTRLQNDVALVVYAKANPVKTVAAFILAVIAATWIADNITIDTILKLIH